MARNVASQAEKPKVRRKKVRPWEPEELGLWLDSIADDPLYSLFHLGAFAGLRRGELAGLGWDEVDLDEGRLTVRWQITNVRYRRARLAIKNELPPVWRTKPKTRDGEERIVYLDSGTVDVLRLRKKQQEEEAAKWGAGFSNPDNLVFTRENGDPWDPHYLYHRFVATVEKLGLRMVPLHMLRHIAASLLILAGVDIAVVSKILGHSKIDLTSDTYGHLIGRVAKRAATKAAKQVPRGAAALEAFERSKGETKEKKRKGKGKEAKAKKNERKNGRSQDPFS